MIYTANTVKHTDLSLTEDALYIPARERESSLLEDAYVFLYESDYNFNTIVNEINFHESAAAAENAELVLEAADIKTIFTNIKNWIVTAWRRFVDWLKGIRDRIKEFFSKNKSDKKADKKTVEENLKKLKEEKKEIKGVDVDKKKIEEVQSKVENIDLSKIEDCKTPEEVKAVTEEFTKQVVGGNTSASTEGLVKAVESELGLNKEVNLVEKITASDIIEADEKKAVEATDKAAKVAKAATDKAESALNNLSKDAATDNEIKVAREEYNLLVAQANGFRYCANLALTVSTATTKAEFINTKQIAELSHRVVSSMKENREDLEKKLEVFKFTRAGNKTIEELYGKTRIIRDLVDSDIDKEEKLRIATDRLHSICSRLGYRISGTTDINELKDRIANDKNRINVLVSTASSNGIQIKTLQKSEFTENRDKWDRDYFSLLQDLVFGDKDSKGYHSHAYIVNADAYFHYIEVLIYTHYTTVKGRPGEFKKKYGTADDLDTGE